MGSAGNPGFDTQNYFKTGNPANLAAPTPTQPPFHPFNPGNFPPATSYQTPTSGSFAFPMYQHNPYTNMNYSQEQASRPHPTPPAYTQQGPSAQLRLSSPIPSPPSDGAKLMALLNTHSTPSSLELPSTINSSEPFQVSMQPMGLAPPALPTAPPVNLAPQRTPSRLLSSKLPRGRCLHGDRVVYDIDLRLPGEAQPQLEVSPITVYTSDPLLVGGQQIAVNGNYICYGLRAGNIRILNINTALRALLRGHLQRVTDMAFFSNDVHLLASASSDGRIFIWKIKEDLGDDDKTHITEQIVFAIQILGDWESVHPHVCWHSQQQDVLFVGISNYLLKIDAAKLRSAAPGGVFSADDPVKCHIDSLAEGVHCIGKHDGEVTDLSIYHWGMTYLASASKDGMVKIWGDKKMLPVVAFKPHDGQPVGSVGFLTIPHSPDHVVLLTAGPLNQELKLWVCASPDGRFSPSSSGKWQCIQTLELKSSLEPRNEDAFFNQVFVVPRASVILLANAKRNAIYAVHMEYGLKPLATRIDYLTEFSVAMPILSFTATSENVADSEGTIQIYCVQTQAIQQYALELSQCFPPPVELGSLDEDTVSRVFDRSTLSAFTPVESTVSSGAKSPRSTNVPDKVSTHRSPVFPPTVDPSHAHDQLAVSCVGTTFGLSMPMNVTADNVPLSSQVPVPLSPSLSRRLSGVKSPSENFKRDHSPISSIGDQSDKHMVKEHPIEKKQDNVMITSPDMSSLETVRIMAMSRADDSSNVKEEMEDAAINIQCEVSSSPSYLITPSQLLSMVAPSSESAGLDKESNIHNKFEETDTKTENEKLKLGIKDAGKSCLNKVEEVHSEKGDASVSIHTVSQASEPGNSNSKESGSLSTSAANLENAQPGGECEVFEDREHSPNVSIEESQENVKDISCKVSVSALTPATFQSPAGTKRRKNKNKNLLAPLPSTSPSGTPFTSVGSSDGEPINTISIPSAENIAAQVVAMQETLNQIIASQKELQKQMTGTVALPIAKEGKRMEAALGQRMEKLLKAQVDALWARIQEENAKRERSERQLSAMLTNTLNKELPATLERLLKKEIGNLGPSVARLVTPSVEKAISTSINDAFQKGISDKAMTLLEKSVATKLEPALSRQIQTQFQSSGKQVLQDSLRTCFEASVIPAFDHSCRAMFEQVDTAFRKGMAEHTSAAQQQFSASHSALASTLKDTVASASSLAQSLKSDLADGQRKLLALAENAGTSSRVGASNTKQISGGLGGLPEKAISLEHLEESLDPTKELSRLVSECKFEEAFNKALQLSDVSIVSWLCSQVDHNSLFSTIPLPLTQGVLLALVQQLSCDLEKDTGRKLLWITEASNVLNPNEPLLAQYMRSILTNVYKNLHLLRLPNNSGPEVKSLRMAVHVVNSLLATYNKGYSS